MQNNSYMVDTFKEFGNGFQIKSLTAMLDDKVYLSKIADAIKPNYYDLEEHQFICVEIIKYYAKYKSQPTDSAIAHSIANIKNADTKTRTKIAFMEIIKARNSEDLDFIKDSVVEFCKNQALKVAIYESVELLKNKQYDVIKSKIDVALSVGIDTNIGHDYIDEIEERYTEEIRNPVSTPWEVINEITKGGFGIGDLGIIMGLPGSGKSWFLCALGAHALKQGKNVIHYTLELSDFYVGRRYDTILTGISIDELDLHKETIKHSLKDFKSKLVIKRYFPRAVTTLGLRGHLDKCIRLGFKPDLILVDYADLMGMIGGGELRHKIEQLYEDLKCIGGEYACPVLSVSQLNRQGIGEDFIDSDIAAAEAFSKNNTPDFIMTFTRPERMREINGVLAYVTKNRFGGDKIKLVGPMDTTTGTIDLYSVNEQKAVDFMNGAISEEDRMRAVARERFNSLSTSNALTSNINF